MTISVTDTNPAALTAKSLSVTNSYTITVNEVNVAPVLTLPPNTNINEQVAYTATATATDSDLPANALTFALVSGPAGLTVASNGVINWTPLESQGPSNYVVTISVTDTNPAALTAKSLSVTNSYSITVNEVNLAPSIFMPANQTLHATRLLSVTATATDPDQPANTLIFGLVSGPGGLNVASGGLITWTPTDADIGSTNVRVRVFDNGTPSLSATGTFTITVVSRPLLSSPVLTNGTNVLLTWSSFSGGVYRLQYLPAFGATNASNWVTLSGDVTAAGNFATKVHTNGHPAGTNQMFYRVMVP